MKIRLISVKPSCLVLFSLGVLFLMSGSYIGCPSGKKVSIPIEPKKKTIVITKKQKPDEDRIDFKHPSLTKDGILEVEDPKGTALDAFYNSLFEIKQHGEEGRACILHFGDSHIAADMLTGQLRRRLQTEFGDRGRGFILPGKPWWTYWMANVNHGGTRGWKVYNGLFPNHSGPFGLGGIRMIGANKNDYAWVETAEKGPIGLKASFFEIFYLKVPNGGEMKVVIDKRKKYIIDTEYNKTKLGFARFDVKDGPHHFQVSPLGNGKITLLGFVMERDVPGVVYDTLGLNGGESQMMLRWDFKILDRHIQQRQPDLIITSFGTNESVNDSLVLTEYKRTYFEFLSRLRHAAPKASCLVIGPPDINRREISDCEPRPGRGYPGRTKIPKDEYIREGCEWLTPVSLIKIIIAQKLAAQKAGCGFWDTFTYMGGKESLEQWANLDPPLGAADHVHLTINGYYKIADALYQSLMMGYNAYAKSRMKKARKKTVLILKNDKN